jgi:hypothetical protein
LTSIAIMDDWLYTFETCLIKSVLCVRVTSLSLPRGGRSAEAVDSRSRWINGKMLDNLWYGISRTAVSTMHVLQSPTTTTCGRLPELHRDPSQRGMQFIGHDRDRLAGVAEPGTAKPLVLLAPTLPLSYR